MTFRCPTCNSPRQNATCWKCETKTFTPSPHWSEPELPPVDPIRALAKEVGYAIAEHGSKERDLDLVAVPWTDSAVGWETLLEHIVEGLNAKVLDTELKPHGRIAVSIQMDGWYRVIDLSITKRID